MKIALTYTGWDGKHKNYVEWLAGENRQAPSGEVIEIVRLSAREKNADLLDQCDGLVLSGGVDIHPSFYQGAMKYHHSPKNWQKDRDVFEQVLLRNALERRLPVMGVCRGLQLINVAFHGSLVQDLGEKGDEVHEDLGGKDRAHFVKVEPGSMLSDISGVQRGAVNSAHHQAIDRLGEGLQACSLADDGTIEAIEWKDPLKRPFLLAVQWHPERMDGFDDKGLYQSIRDRFIDEIAR
jgi:putative glutamine amidotransferase